LFHRYAVLCTMFIHEGINRPLQLVLKDRAVEFHFKDIQDWDEADREKFIREFKEKILNGVLI